MKIKFHQYNEKLKKISHDNCMIEVYLDNSFMGKKKEVKKKNSYGKFYFIFCFYFHLNPEWLNPNIR